MMATWDLDHVIDAKKWILLLADEPDTEALEHLNETAKGSSGTVVVWNKVDRLLNAYQDPAGSHARHSWTRCAGAR